MEDLFAGILCLILSDIQAYYQYNFHVLNNFDIESDIAKKMTNNINNNIYITTSHFRHL